MRSVFLVLAALAGCAQPAQGTGGDATPGDGRPHDGVLGDGMPGDGTVATTSNVSVIVEPNGNHMTELVTAIAGAHVSVYMTMYQLDDNGVTDALVARAQAGLDVRVVLDSASANKTWNQSAFDQLHAAGANVVWSNPAYTYTHEKCVIIDATQAWIMTMNANTSPPSSNREYIAIDSDAADVTEAIAVFDADHALQTINPMGKLVVAPQNARGKLVQLIGTATHDLDLEGEEFSDTYSTGIANALAAAAHAGVAVRVVIANSTPTATETQAITTVKQAGAHVVITGPTSANGSINNPYIHAKAIVIDCGTGTCARGFVGSENFSGGSLGYNRELGVIFDDATQLAKIETAIQSDFAHGTAQ